VPSAPSSPSPPVVPVLLTRPAHPAVGDGADSTSGLVPRTSCPGCAPRGGRAGRSRRHRPARRPVQPDPLSSAAAQPRDEAVHCRPSTPAQWALNSKASHRHPGRLADGDTRRRSILLRIQRPRRRSGATVPDRKVRRHGNRVVRQPEESSPELNQRRINSIDSYMEYVSRSIDAHRHGDPLRDQAVQVG
jgi:hypothetical protein